MFVKLYVTRGIIKIILNLGSVACGIWCLADVSSVSPSSEQTAV